MTLSTDDARTFRELLRSAAAEPRLPRPLPILGKSRTPLARGGESLGHLDALLRLSFRPNEEPDGVLVFEWPDAAASHSAIRPLDGWVARCGADGTGQHGGVSVESRRTGDCGDGPADRTHLKLRFAVADLPDELMEALQLAVRTGIGRLVRSPLESALRKARNGLAPAAANGTNGAAHGTARVAATAHAEPAPELEPVLELEPEPEPEPEPAPELSPEERARVDAIQSGDEFDADRHPTVELNGEVTNSEGATFRLVWKRAGGAHKRIWTKVPHRVEAPAVTHTRHAGVEH